MALYCPFWMLNKTGLMLSYRVCSQRSDPLVYLRNFDFSIFSQTFIIVLLQLCLQGLISLKISENLLIHLFRVSFYQKYLAMQILCDASSFYVRCINIFILVNVLNCHLLCALPINVLLINHYCTLPDLVLCIEHAPLFSRNQVKVEKNIRVQSR